MKSDGLFGWLVRYQVSHNLNACKRWISDDGVFHDPETDSPLELGDENPLTGYKGLLILANGDTLISKLREQNIINDKKDPVFSTPVKNEEDFFDYIAQYSKRDGAHLFNGVIGAMGRVIELNNNLPIDNYEHILPPNFIDEAGEIELSEENIGTKTRAGIKVSAANPKNVDIYQIKRTVYNSLGMGIVTHFKEGHLKEMFYLTAAPEGYAGPVIDPEHQIVGVYVSYKVEDDKVVEDRKMYVGLDDAERFILVGDSQIALGERPSLGLEGTIMMDDSFGFDSLPMSEPAYHTQHTPSIDGSLTHVPAGYGTMSDGYLIQAGIGGSTLDSIIGGAAK